MEARMTVLTLGVDDLERSLSFYRDGLGFPTEGIIGTEFEHGAVAFFKLQPGLQLAIWKRQDISYDANVHQAPPSPTEMTIGHNVNSQLEVDKVLEQAKKAGAVVTVSGHETFWGGYSGYFQDPDGHLWEVVWNPELILD
ncbi:VOC family protein [Planococcus sp. CPCC 101016]|uniref:VOC family protein n=1 Tax=Planococcus sp. CPCC 101016 TaxID=2599617 RepID=UPI0011B41E4C|nr:VOC family protein [Planococcus sp. CPCC 101016]TWT07794.1 VOC family protein [Planococcus sp. CPCC 101016]